MVSQVGHLVGYVRVSAADQNEARQFEALGVVERLFLEKVSGDDTDRAQLQEMLACVRAGDTVRVKSPDSLARSTTDLLSLVDQLKSNGVELEFIDNPALSTDTPQCEFMLTILAAVAQLERATISERKAEGIALAKAAGKYARGTKRTPDQVTEAHARVGSGVSKAAVARGPGVSRQRLYTALNDDGRYAA